MCVLSKLCPLGVSDEFPTQISFTDLVLARNKIIVLLEKARKSGTPISLCTLAKIVNIDPNTFLALFSRVLNIGISFWNIKYVAESSSDQTGAITVEQVKLAILAIRPGIIMIRDVSTCDIVAQTFENEGYQIHFLTSTSFQYIIAIDKNRLDFVSSTHHTTPQNMGFVTIQVVDRASGRPYVFFDIDHKISLDDDDFKIFLDWYDDYFESDFSFEFHILPEGDQLGLHDRPEYMSVYQMIDFSFSPIIEQITLALRRVFEKALIDLTPGTEEYRSMIIRTWNDMIENHSLINSVNHMFVHCPDGEISSAIIDFSFDIYRVFSGQVGEELDLFERILQERIVKYYPERYSTSLDILKQNAFEMREPLLTLIEEFYQSGGENLDFDMSRLFDDPTWRSHINRYSSA
jgi:hypothetical protein